MVELREGFKLSSHQWPKRIFNPHDARDLAVFHEFLQNDRWGGPCPFVLEWPFLNILDMIKHKIVYQHIGGLINKTKKVK